MNRHQCSLPAVIAALALGIASGALAQTTSTGSGHAYPTKPVRMVLGYPPGGGIDVLARIMAPKLSERWGEQVVVDNRPGASGNIGAEIVAKAAPDGYTLLMMTLSHAVGAGLYSKLPFHPADSFSGVTLIGATTLVLLSNPSSSMKTVKDVIAAAKAKPGQLSFGSSGIGGSPHLAGELLKLQTGIDIVHVPYKGSGLAFTDLMGGHVPLLMSALPGALPHIKSGKMRAIGVTSMQRSPAVPEVPTIAESGVPGYEVRHWFGALAPAGTDRKVLERLHDEFVVVLRMPDVAEAFSKAGADPVSNTPREFDAYLRAEIARWTKVVRAAHVKAE
ncbi:MAG: tripartite tricarboxylate transporter substrate binding protein [Burkholderiales bacterium]